jgi:hypothetical protein
MYNGQKVIDVHGHFSAPPELNQFSMSLINLRRRIRGSGARATAAVGRS